MSTFCSGSFSSQSAPPELLLISEEIWLEALAPRIRGSFLNSVDNALSLPSYPNGLGWVGPPPPQVLPQELLMATEEREEYF